MAYGVVTDAEVAAAWATVPAQVLASADLAEREGALVNRWEKIDPTCLGHGDVGDYLSGVIVTVFGPSSAAKVALTLAGFVRYPGKVAAVQCGTEHDPRLFEEYWEWELNL